MNNENGTSLFGGILVAIAAVGAAVWGYKAYKEKPSAEDDYREAVNKLFAAIMDNNASEDIVFLCCENARDKRRNANLAGVKDKDLVFTDLDLETIRDMAKRKKNSFAQAYLAEMKQKWDAKSRDTQG